MPFFGKKKEQLAVVKPPEIYPVGQPKEMPPAKPEVQRVETETQVNRPAFAPLFVKIDRYRQMLTVLGSLKTAMMIVKNSFTTLGELEKAREETYTLIKETVEKVDKKIIDLDAELIRPAGFHDAVNTATENLAYQDVQTVEATIADLKGQIDQLKSELERMA